MTRRPSVPSVGTVGRPAARVGEAAAFESWGDPYLATFMRGGGAVTESGAVISVEAAMKNTAVFRCVSLIASAIGMLPLHLMAKGEAKRKAAEHPLFTVLHRRPNGWQTAFDFRSLVQGWALVHGDGYALVVRRGREVIGLVPLDPKRTTVRQEDDFRVVYEHQRRNGTRVIFRAEEVLHVRGLSLDGLKGVSTVRQAAEAIGLANQAERAAARLFRNGTMTGGALKMPSGQKLSPAAVDRLKAEMRERYEGAENAHRWMILEEGLEAVTFAPNAKDSQHAETRRMQIEEIARAFGVPRPFLMVDDTSWGTGIDVLGQAFVRFGLNPWFTAWEQAIERSCLVGDEPDRLEAKFNAGALLRGNMKDQAEFFAKALGSGGSAPWMHPNEVRELMELPPRDDLATRPAPVEPNGPSSPPPADSIEGAQS